MTEQDLRKLPPLSIPVSGLGIMKDESGHLRIYDILRHKYVNLTPEEWVRQNFVNWIINYKGYPKSLIGNEVEVKLNETSKRCDTVVFDRNCKALIIIEYKAPDVEITQATFDQIVRYNMMLKAKYLIVSNGLRQYCCIIDYQRNTYQFIKTVPDYIEAAGILPDVN